MHCNSLQLVMGAFTFKTTLELLGAICLSAVLVLRMLMWLSLRECGANYSLTAVAKNAGKSMYYILPLWVIWPEMHQVFVAGETLVLSLPVKLKDLTYNSLSQMTLDLDDLASKYLVDIYCFFCFSWSTMTTVPLVGARSGQLTAAAVEKWCN